MAHITFNNKDYTIPAGSTAQATFDSLKTAIPEMANAKLKKDGDNFKAETALAEKG